MKLYANLTFVTRKSGLFLYLLTLVFLTTAPMKLFAVLMLFCFGCYSQPDSIAVHRARINADFADADKSPLTQEDRARFTGLDFYPYDTKYHVTAKLTRNRHSKPFAMKTTTNRMPMYREFGTLEFEIDGKKMTLSVFQNMDLALKPGFKDYLFLPFMDMTSGKETYIGGRYLDLRIPEGTVLELDFNKAYNSYCAYYYKYSCPLVPAGNDLPVEIRAGVKKFHD